MQITYTQNVYKLSYWVGSTIVESTFFPTKALALWKKKELLNQGTHKQGVFKIIKL